MSDASKRHEQEYALQLAHFIVGCLVLEDVIKVDPELMRPQDVNSHFQQMKLDTANRVIARCLEGRLSDEFSGLPFSW